MSFDLAVAKYVKEILDALTTGLGLSFNGSAISESNTLPVVAGGYTKSARATPTLTVAATYVANDYVGTSGVAMIFEDCARINAGTGWIIGAHLIDYALQSIAAELWIFDSAITPPSDSAAWTLTDAQLLRKICVIPFSTYYPSAANSSSDGYPASPAAFKTLTASKRLYGCLVTRGAPAYATGDLTVILDILQD